MSKKDRLKAEKEGPRARPQPEVETLCAYPPCRRVIRRPAPGRLVASGKGLELAATPQATEAAPPFCTDHQALVEFLLWAMPRVRIERGKTAHGLVTPGAPEFKATLEGGNRP